MRKPFQPRPEMNFTGHLRVSVRRVASRDVRGSGPAAGARDARPGQWAGFAGQLGFARSLTRHVGPLTSGAPHLNSGLTLASGIGTDPAGQECSPPKLAPLRHQSQAQVVAALRMTGYERSPRAPPQVGRVSQSSSRNSGRPWAHWVAGSLQKAVTRSGRREEMCRVWSGEGRGAASTSGHHSPHISAPSPTWKLPEPRPLHCPGSFLTQVRLIISRW